MEFNRAGIDLHIHTTASDGTLSPAEILQLAHRLKLGAISITDHDTLQGIREIFPPPDSSGVKVLAGIEISTKSPPLHRVTGSFHILGYGIRLSDPVLNQTLDTLQQARKDRNPLIIGRLNELGVDITLAEVMEASGEEAQIGRPHIAKMIINKGYAQSIDEAFDIYLGFNKPAYVDKYRLGCQEAINIIRGAGGIPVLAHPFLLKIADSPSMEALILDLKDMGMQGIEAYYPEHPPEYFEFLSGIARKYDLVITGGTDFHGKLKPDIQLGSGSGDFFVPYSVYENLLRYQQK